MNVRRLLAAGTLLALLALFNAFALRPETGALAAASAAAAAPALLLPQPPVVVPGGPGHYDWMTVDPQNRRVLAAHPGTGTLVVADLDGSAPVRVVDTGPAQGIAVDSPDHRYFIGGTDNQLITILDSRTLAKTGEIKVTGPVDAMVFEPKRRMVYAGHDDGTELWVIDARTGKLAGSVTIAGPPEQIQYDPVTDRLYQNIKTTNSVQVIDPSTQTVSVTWPTAPATGPHGLVVDGKAHRLFSAGNNGKLAAIDTRTGKLIGSADIARGVDQIAFDPALKRIYCASGTGAISVVEETADGVTSLGDVPAPRGTHTLAVDPKTHAVWISYVDGSDSCLKEYMVSRQEAAQ